MRTVIDSRFSRAHALVGVGVFLVVVGFVVVPALDMSQPRYGFDATPIDGPEIEHNDWTIEEFTYLSSADQDRVRTMVNNHLYYSYGDDDPFHFDVIIYNSDAYQIELVEIAEPSPFATILSVPLVIIGAMVACYGGYCIYRTEQS